MWSQILSLTISETSANLSFFKFRKIYFFKKYWSVWEFWVVINDKVCDPKYSSVLLYRKPFHEVSKKNSLTVSEIIENFDFFEKFWNLDFFGVVITDNACHPKFHPFRSISNFNEISANLVFWKFLENLENFDFF